MGESTEEGLSFIIHLYLAEVGTFVMWTVPSSSVYWKNDLDGTVGVYRVSPHSD